MFHNTHIRAGLLLALLCAPLCAQQGGDPDAEFKALGQQMRDAQNAYFEKYNAEVKAAKEKGGMIPAFSWEGLNKEFLGKYRAAAEKYQKQDGAVQFLSWVARVTEDDAERAKVVEQLLTDHIRSPRLGDAVDTIAHLGPALGDDKVHEALDRIVKEAGTPDVQARALYARADLVLGKDEKPDDAARNAAILDLKEAIARVADAELKSRYEGALYEQEHLQNGMPAPDITGVDLDGVAFKLSDYKGKVILLDFWGYW